MPRLYPPFYLIAWEPRDNAELLDCGGRASHSQTNRGGCIYYRRRSRVADLRQAEEPANVGDHVQFNLCTPNKSEVTTADGGERPEDGGGVGGMNGRSSRTAAPPVPHPRRIPTIFFFLENTQSHCAASDSACPSLDTCINGVFGPRL